MLTLPLILRLMACVCLAVAVLIAAWPMNGNFDAWLAGGLLSWALSWLAEPLLKQRVPQ